MVAPKFKPKAKPKQKKVEKTQQEIVFAPCSLPQAAFLTSEASFSLYGGKAASI